MKFCNSLLVFAAICLFSCGSQDTSSDKNREDSLRMMLPSAEAFDTVMDGKKVGLIYLHNKNGMHAAVTNYGARMVGLWLPDKAGKWLDIVVGLPTIQAYVVAEERFFGAIVGRFGNRIAKGKFTLDGKSYQLDINNPPNTLHGGRTGFHSRVWEMMQPDSQTVRLTYISPDGEEGYPGNLTVNMEYQLTDSNELLMSYEIFSDQKTIANITNHNYWNLNGEGSGSINEHTLQILADQYTPVDATLIPTGIETVDATPFDFRQPKTIGKDLDTSAYQQLGFGKGYDHNFVLNKGITTDPELLATISGDKSGIKMEILSTEPGLQFYGGNFMQGKHTFKNGSKDDFRTAFCVETQHFPDSPNQSNFPSTVVEPGIVYVSKTIHKFTTVR